MPIDDFPRLRPACDPPLKAGFVFLGSRLLANQREHSAPTRARCQFMRCAETATTCAAWPVFQLVRPTDPAPPSNPQRAGVQPLLPPRYVCVRLPIGPPARPHAPP